MRIINKEINNKLPKHINQIHPHFKGKTDDDKITLTSENLDKIINELDQNLISEEDAMKRLARMLLPFLAKQEDTPTEQNKKRIKSVIKFLEAAENTEQIQKNKKEKEKINELIYLYQSVYNILERNLNIHGFNDINRRDRLILTQVIGRAVGYPDETVGKAGIKLSAFFLGETKEEAEQERQQRLEDRKQNPDKYQISREESLKRFLSYYGE